MLWTRYLWFFGSKVTMESPSSYDALYIIDQIIAFFFHVWELGKRRSVSMGTLAVKLQSSHRPVWFIFNKFTGICNVQIGCCVCYIASLQQWLHFKGTSLTVRHFEMLKKPWIDYISLLSDEFIIVDWISCLNKGFVLSFDAKVGV